MVANSLVEELISAVKTNEEKKNTTYSAIVTRVDKDGTAWVCIAGSEKETPVSSSATGIKRGDAVNVEWRNNKIYIAGNRSDPATGDAAALAARALAIIAESRAAGAQDTASEAQDTAVNAKETAESILIYDHGYEYDPTTGIASFEAYLYRGGVDVKAELDTDGNPLFPPELFTWYLKTEDGQEPILNDQGNNYGYTCEVDTHDCGYGAEVIGYFTTNDDSIALTETGDTYTDTDGIPYTVRATGESVRVRDLHAATALYHTDKLMAVGAEDEHLVTVQTLQNYLNANLDKQILFGTTAEWDAQSQLQSAANTIYVYKDHKRDSQNRAIAGIKVGDGNAYLIDLPFTDEVEMEHISDTDIHITAAERLAWNNKVSCYYSSADTLVFVTS